IPQLAKVRHSFLFFLFRKQAKKSDVILLSIRVKSQCNICQNSDIFKSHFFGSGEFLIKANGLVYEK
ncbi:hypothetical protein, partial [Yeosuana sp.]|uniref:hypothetical protein n=1 Tax=Yeosuana sp. TaxID=2529388 RepID=UPI0040553516